MSRYKKSNIIIGIIGLALGIIIGIAIPVQEIAKEDTKGTIARKEKLPEGVGTALTTIMHKEAGQAQFSNGTFNVFSVSPGLNIQPKTKVAYAVTGSDGRIFVYVPSPD